LYEAGRGVPKDLGQAMKWYAMAAKQGNEWGRRNLEKLQAVPLQAAQ
jgi:TPR repeat protein